MTTFHFILKTPEATLYDGEVKKITLVTEQGELQMMAHHASLTGSIIFSPVRIDDQKAEDTFMVRNGTVLFNNKTNTAMILALYGECKSEITHQTAQEYLKFIEKELKAGHDLSEYQILYLEGEKLAIEQQLKIRKN